MLKLRLFFSFMSLALFTYWLTRSCNLLFWRRDVIIPQQIWQIYFGYSPIGTEDQSMLGLWPLMNQGVAYRSVGTDQADDFVADRYRDRPDIRDTYLSLRSPIFKSDLLRYMLLEYEGGIYSDLDTESLKPFRQWIPEALKPAVGFVVGIEYDQGTDGRFVNMAIPLQICQWTMAGSRHHPIAREAVRRSVAELQALAARNASSIADFMPSDVSVLSITGPVMFTHVVLDVLQQMIGEPLSYGNLSGLVEPRLIGDVLILPVDGFGMGQPHSHSTTDGRIPEAAMVRHRFRGSWKDGWM